MATSEQNTKLEGLYEKQFCHCSDCFFKGFHQQGKQKLAEWLHFNFCSHNHTDMCSWYYEKDDWSQWTHQRYLQKVKKLIEEMSEAIFQMAHSK